MTSQVIVPHRPGPLVDVPDEDGPAPGEPQAGLFGAPEIVLAVGGGALLAAVLLTGLPGWLSVVAVACLALGLALPAHAALLLAMRRRGERRRRQTLGRGTVLDVSDPSGAPPRHRVPAAGAYGRRRHGPRRRASRAHRGRRDAGGPGAGGGGGGVRHVPRRGGLRPGRPPRRRAGRCRSSSPAPTPWPGSRPCSPDGSHRPVRRRASSGEAAFTGPGTGRPRASCNRQPPSWTTGTPPRMACASSESVPQSRRRR